MTSSRPVRHEIVLRILTGLPAGQAVWARAMGRSGPTPVSSA